MYVLFAAFEFCVENGFTDFQFFLTAAQALAANFYCLLLFSVEILIIFTSKIFSFEFQKKKKNYFLNYNLHTTAFN